MITTKVLPANLCNNCTALQGKQSNQMKLISKTNLHLLTGAYHRVSQGHVFTKQKQQKKEKNI